MPRIDENISANEIHLPCVVNRSNTFAGDGGVAFFTAAAIDFDGKIIPLGFKNTDKIRGLSSSVDSITQVIGWDATSSLMLKCMVDGAGDDEVHFKAAEDLPVFSYCHMQLAANKSHIQCYLA